LMFRNRIINGDMRIDQRNSGAAVTVPTAGSVFPVDRFKVERANGYVNTATAQQIADGPTGFTRSLRYTAGTAETPTGSLYSTIQQAIEGFNFADLGWGSAGASSATLSFWVKISITGTFGIILRSADATLSYATTFSYSSANTWQYVTLNIPGPTTGGTTAFTVTNGVGVTVFWELGTGPTLSTAASSSWQSVNALGVTGSTKLNSTSGATYQITGVQLEAGPTATPFERRPIGMELALCQRYYQVIANNSGSSMYISTVGAYTATRAFTTLALQVPMRTLDLSVADTNIANLVFYNIQISAVFYISGISVYAKSPNILSLDINTSTNMVAGSLLTFTMLNGGSIRVSAEL